MSNETRTTLVVFQKRRPLAWLSQRAAVKVRYAASTKTTTAVSVQMKFRSWRMGER